jgi:hypothetical protein
VPDVVPILMRYPAGVHPLGASHDRSTAGRMSPSAVATAPAALASVTKAVNPDAALALAAAAPANVLPGDVRLAPAVATDSAAPRSLICAVSAPVESAAAMAAPENCCPAAKALVAVAKSRGGREYIAGSNRRRNTPVTECYPISENVMLPDMVMASAGATGSSKHARRDGAMIGRVSGVHTLSNPTRMFQFHE